MSKIEAKVKSEHKKHTWDIFQPSWNCLISFNGKVGTGLGAYCTVVYLAIVAAFVV